MEIDKDVPMPVNYGRNGRPARFPWQQMVVGDSFSVGLHDVANCRACASSWGKRHGASFLVAKDFLGDYRCWRTA